MKCKEINKNLLFYIEGELSQEKEKLIKEHLHNCQNCLMLFNEIKETLAVIEGEKKIEPTPFLFTRIQQHITNLENQESLTELQPIFKRILQPIALTLLLLAGVYFGISLGNSFKSEKFEKTIVYQTDEFYFNDFQQESIEAFILNEY